MADLAPDSISKETNRILVKPTLQIADPDDAFPHIFALGDVAETGGPRMARAGQFQAEIVLANIIALINERNPSTVYKPRLDFEGAIKLTLGKVRAYTYLHSSTKLTQSFFRRVGWSIRRTMTAVICWCQATMARKTWTLGWRGRPSM